MLFNQELSKFFDDDKEVKHNDNIIDVKPKNEQIKTSVDEKIHVSPSRRLHRR